MKHFVVVIPMIPTVFLVLKRPPHRWVSTPYWACISQLGLRLCWALILVIGLPIAYLFKMIPFLLFLMSAQSPRVNQLKSSSATNRSFYLTEYNESPAVCLPDLDIGNERLVLSHSG
ncbi:uncharacterized protein BDW43DRAFT_151446 [Aspergillus alliaceus]|uniref:uncharacterized protein n=1 Tax=Petromyces alliaceus TaxID=209559 RepID=UPI0012A51CA3|nr:uncharacterized protein BDW43DRAFT_151446 [Aspergillus alliaceus]KAB8237993.1 hypothetical protein BDW43DRAFT_151446 [Aspergillus alliaceus]